MDNVKIDIKTGTIGPHHDPYGTELVVVRRGTKEASWYSDGLGQERLWLVEGQEIVRKLEWIDVTYSKDSANKEALAKILFRRWVGISCADAKEEYERQYNNYEDPMGRLSDYV